MALGVPWSGCVAAASTGDDVGGLGGGERGTEAAGAGQGGSNVLSIMSMYEYLMSSMSI